MTDLSIVVVTWRSREEIGPFLESIPAAVGDLQFEVVVVDNDSGDGTVEAVRSSPLPIRCIESGSNLGFGRGVELGRERARGRFLAVANPDTRPAPDSLAALVRFLDARPAAGWVGPRLLLPDGRVQSAPMPLPCLRHALKSYPLLSRLQRPPRHAVESGPVRCGWVRGPCSVFRQEAIAAIGGMPTDRFMYGEEIRLGHRLARAGWQVWYDPGPEVVHLHGASADRRWQADERDLRIAAGRIDATREALGPVRFFLWSAASSIGLLLSSLAQHRPASKAARTLARLHWRALTGRDAERRP